MGPCVASGSAIKTDPEPLLGSSISTLLLLFHTRKSLKKLSNVGLRRQYSSVPLNDLVLGSEAPCKVCKEV